MHQSPAVAQITANDETAAIVTTFTQRAIAVEGLTTYGTPAERYDAVAALRPAPGGCGRYLIDRLTGELVISIAALPSAARECLGRAPMRGWIEARMQSLGFAYVCIDGYRRDYVEGLGAHVGAYAYRGHLPQPGPQDYT